MDLNDISNLLSLTPHDAEGLTLQDGDVLASQKTVTTEVHATGPKRTKLRAKKSKRTEREDLIKKPRAKKPKKNSRAFLKAKYPDVKPPRNGHQIFVSEQVSKLKESDTTVAGSNLLIRVGEKWSKLNDDEKEVYKNKARVEAEEYRKKLEDLGHSWEKKRTTPLSAYIFFCTEQIEHMKDMKCTEAFKEIGRRWRNMDEAEKEPYRKMSDEDRKTIKGV